MRWVPAVQRGHSERGGRCRSDVRTVTSRRWPTRRPARRRSSSRAVPARDRADPPGGPPTLALRSFRRSVEHRLEETTGAARQETNASASPRVKCLSRSGSAPNPPAAAVQGSARRLSGEPRPGVKRRSARRRGDRRESGPVRAAPDSSSACGYRSAAGSSRSTRPAGSEHRREQGCSSLPSRDTESDGLSSSAPSRAKACPGRAYARRPLRRAASRSRSVRRSLGQTEAMVRPRWTPGRRLKMNSLRHPRADGADSYPPRAPRLPCDRRP